MQTLGAAATIWGHGLSLLWRPPIELGDRWSYALGATVPFMWAEVSANVTVGPKTGQITSRVNGLGDIVLMPPMLIWFKLAATFCAGLLLASPSPAP